MKNISKALAVLLLLTLQACQKEPVVRFTANKTQVKVGEPVTFTNNTKNGHSYEWDFGDGTFSNEESPVKTFDKAGTFSVRLEAYSKNGKKEDRERLNITVEEKLNAHFIGVTDLEANYTEEICTGNNISYDSRTINYQLTVKAGANDEEIILDNLGGIGINNVKAKVRSDAIPFFATYTFELLAGQTLTDAKGQVWEYKVSDVTGTYEEYFKCKSLSIYLSRPATCAGSGKLYFSEEAYTPNCY